MTTDKIKDGGPAFPTDGFQKTHEGFAQRQGMSLREWFAGQALIAAFPAIMAMPPRDLPELAAKLGLSGSVTPYDLVAAASLKTAEAMLKAREASDA